MNYSILRNLGFTALLVSLLTNCQYINEDAVIAILNEEPTTKTSVPITSDCIDTTKIPSRFFIPDDKPEVKAEGCAGITYDDWENSLYVLPFPVGTGFRIGLNNCSASYHGPNQPDQFATDFNMPIGTCLSASRAGKVIFVEEGGEDGGFPNNKIIIDHGDGTFGQYMHLTKNGAILDEGEVVKQGQFIGYSGNTGLAGYPHLHFIVTKIGWEYPYQGVPVNFKNTYANEQGLAKGKLYYALSYED